MIFGLLVALNIIVPYELEVQKLKTILSINQEVWSSTSTQKEWDNTDFQFIYTPLTSGHVKLE